VFSGELSKKKAGLEALSFVVLGLKNSNEGLDKFTEPIVNIMLEVFNDGDSKVWSIAIKPLNSVTQAIRERLFRVFIRVF
jgi:hypothetical protein